MKPSHIRLSLDTHIFQTQKVFDIHLCVRIKFLLAMTTTATKLGLTLTNPITRALYSNSSFLQKRWSTQTLAPPEKMLD